MRESEHTDWVCFLYFFFRATYILTAETLNRNDDLNKGYTIWYHFFVLHAKKESRIFTCIWDSKKNVRGIDNSGVVKWGYSVKMQLIKVQYRNLWHPRFSKSIYLEWWVCHVWSELCIKFWQAPCHIIFYENSCQRHRLWTRNVRECVINLQKHSVCSIFGAVCKISPFIYVFT